MQQNIDLTDGWLFSIDNPRALYEKIKSSGQPLSQFIEALFLIGKVEDSLKEEIAKILEEQAAPCIVKLFKGKSKIAVSGKSTEIKARIKKLISFAKKSDQLDIGKLYCLLRTGDPIKGDLNIYSNKHPLSKEPEYLERFNGIHQLSTMYGFPEKFPESIGALQSLEELTIKEQNITELPASIGLLKQLKSLRLEVKSLKEIPSCIKELDQLEILRIQGAHYDYETTDFRLPEWLGQLKGLKELRLAYLQEEIFPETLFSESLEVIQLAQLKQLKKIPSVGHCRNLKKFSLATSDQITELPAALSSLKMLEELKVVNMRGLKVLDGNLVYGPQLKKARIDGVEAEITEPDRSIKGFKTLNVRNLNYFNYLLKNPDLFPEIEELNLSNLKGNLDTTNGLGAFKKLKRLKLYVIELNDSFINDLGKCTLLEDLEIYFWNATQLPNLMGCEHFKSLRIHQCTNLELSFSQLPEQLPHLKIFNINQVNFESTARKVVSTFECEGNSLVHLSKIGMHQFESLYIYCNDTHTIDGAIRLETLPASFSQLTSLKQVDLNISIKNVPDVFSMLPHLADLSIQGYNINHLGEPSNPIEFIDPAILRSSSIRKLTISNYRGDHLEDILSPNSVLVHLSLKAIVNGDTLPDISHLTHLKELVIENHRGFTSFKNPLPKLERLELRWCKKVTPAIYAQIASMTHLKEVRLISLYEAITRFPVEWHFLEALFLNNSRIDVIPSGIQQFKQLHTLSLYGLDMDALPPELGRLNQLKRLSLGSCWLKHTPIELGVLELEELAMTFSKFAGNNMKREAYAVLVNERTKIVTNFGGSDIAWASAPARELRKKLLGI